MGQLTDLHARLLDLLAAIKTAAPAPGLRVYDDPPVQLPEMPCVFLLTPDEDNENVDTMMGRSVVTFVIRLCVDARKPQIALLELADVIAQTTDVWLRNTHPSPIDQARRTGMRGVTPVFGVGDAAIATRGADFPLRIEGEFRLTTPV